MSQSFLASLIEALQCAFLLVLITGHPGVKGRPRPLALGVALAFLAGFSLGYMPGISGSLPDNETWAFMRHLFEFAVFYLGLLFVIVKLAPPSCLHGISLFAFGFLLYFFESRSLGFLVHDAGLMKEDVTGALAASVLGTLTGFSPLVFLRSKLGKVPFEKALTLPSLLVAVGALKFAYGGVGGIDDGNILVALQRGIQFFLENAVEHLQYVLMLTAHRFMEVPLTGLAGFLSGDRTATTLLVVFIMLPPVYILVDLFSRPDPDVAGIEVAAERRLRIAFFRRELVYRSAPVIASFILILVSLHAVNAAMNPLSEPTPIPVRESGEREGILSIPLSDRLGDFTDEKLRKYVYYYGSKQIIFIALMKPDGALGVALDECEICKPAEWNKSAQGYAQRGDHLVCKYCMTPIPVSTVNKPGGCNPIPVPFRLEERDIIIALDDLISVYREAKKLDKKGTHL
jgi:uncharacterized membrane protein